MEKRHDVLGIFLAGVTGAAMLAGIAVRTFLPRMILPRLDLPALVLLCLAALVLDHYIAGGNHRNFRWIALYGALIFGIFPFAAGFTAPLEAGILALLGAVTFPAVTFLFDTMMDRLSTGPVAKAAPAVSAFGLFLAVQCLMGIL